MTAETYKDIRDSLPPDVESRLLKDEKAYYYLTGGGGCLGWLPKTFFLLTDSRVILQSVEKQEGCLGLFTSKTTRATEIPLEHISSVSFESRGGGCLGGGNQISVRSGTAGEDVLVQNPQEAQNAVKALQQLLRERRGR
jgi:hypothetical protein